MCTWSCQSECAVWLTRDRTIISDDEGSSPKRSKAATKANSRARSLTPPPQLTKEQLEKVLAPVRCVTQARAWPPLATDK